MGTALEHSEFAVLVDGDHIGRRNIPTRYGWTEREGQRIYKAHPLHGADAPRTISLEIRNVPGGDCDVRSALINRVGRERAAVRTQITVLGSAGGE